jgi:hypothetical protein
LGRPGLEPERSSCAPAGSSEFLGAASCAEFREGGVDNADWELRLAGEVLRRALGDLEDAVDDAGERRQVARGHAWMVPRRLTRIGRTLPGQVVPCVAAVATPVVEGRGLATSTAPQQRKFAIRRERQTVKQV